MRSYQASDFQNLLQAVDKRLHIYCGNDDTKPAGIWLVSKGEYTELVGVPKNWVPEFNEFSAHGKLLKRGWRGILRALISMKIFTYADTIKAFGHWKENREPDVEIEKKDLEKAFADIEERAYMKRIENPLQPGQMIDTAVYRTDDVVDVGRMISKEKGNAR